MTRTFVAVFPPPEIVENLTALLSRLRAAVPEGVKWVESRNLHLTLRFFGDLIDKKVRQAVEVTEAFGAEKGPVSGRLGGIGAFPGLSRPRVFWIGMPEGGTKLESLAGDLDMAYRRSGFGRADKPFRAHLTVGRVREGLRIDAAPIAGLQYESSPFTLDRISVMKSQLTPKGPIYTSLAEIPLSGQG
jgi:2'-5' RNA ligase